MGEEAYTGEVMMFAGNFVPEGWLPCDGRKLKILDFQVLFSVLGKAYGGDGLVDFGLPDLRGVFPTAVRGQAKPERKASANESHPGAVSISTANLPAHGHSATFEGSAMKIQAPVSLKARQIEGAASPAKGSYLGQGGAGVLSAPIYVPATTTANEVELGGASLLTTVVPHGTVSIPSPVGAGPAQPLQVPFIELQFCICTNGLYPQRP
jgi:microcystin-dependent protein